MKRLIILSAISTYLLVQCTPYRDLNGDYLYGNSIEFRFAESPNRFKYYTKGEMGLLQYSTGEWKLSKNKVYLTGFTDKDINILNVESSVAANINSNGTKVQVIYATEKADAFIRSVVVVNNDSSYEIAKDTILAPEYTVKTIQIKSYLSYQGLLSSPPRIDTLYSRKIMIDGEKGNAITLKFSVNPEDFVRIKFIDTITVKNNRTLLYNNIRLKKSG